MVGDARQAHLFITKLAGAARADWQEGRNCKAPARPANPRLGNAPASQPQLRLSSDPSCPAAAAAAGLASHERGPLGALRAWHLFASPPADRRKGGLAETSTGWPRGAFGGREGARQGDKMALNACGFYDVEVIAGDKLTESLTHSVILLISIC